MNQGFLTIRDMSLPEKKEDKYTYSNYLKWPGDERWEIIGGYAHNMTPAPSVRHQSVAVNFVAFLKQKLKGKPCKPFIAPTDVVLSEYDVVQPDVFVVCDEKKITEQNIQGAPDLIIEILSPFTALKDKREKKGLYAKYGVKEYILVDPVAMYAERFALEKNRYASAEVFGSQEVLPLSFLEEINIPLWEIFEVEPPGEKPGESDEKK